MTLRRIALQLIGALTLGTVPVSAGMLSFNAPDNDVSTTASTTEGGLTTVAVCGYTYASFGVYGGSGGGWQRVDFARLLQDLGLTNHGGGGSSAGNGSTANRQGGGNGFGSSGESGWGNSAGGSGWGSSFGGGYGNGWGDSGIHQGHQGPFFGGLGGPRFPGNTPGGLIHTPWGNGNNGSLPWPDRWDHGDDSSSQHAPEPATLVLLGSGLLASRLVRRRKLR